MDGPRPTAADILERVGFSTEDLRHPVDLLTVEAAAAKAQVAPTTIHSAVGKVSDFRVGVLRQTIACLKTKPGHRTWAALSRAIAGTAPLSPMAEVMSARVEELVDDPAMPLLLSAFDKLSVDGIADTLADTIDSMVDEILPFLETARTIAGTGSR